MTFINGVKINNTIDKNNEQTKKPSINEILDKMQVNYNNMNYAYNNQNVDIMSNNENRQQTAKSSNNANDNSLLLSLLPLILEGKNAGAEILKSQQNELFHTLIKNLNNPLLEKLFDILPKLNKKPVKTEQKTEKPKIESYVKTDEYNSTN